MCSIANLPDWAAARREENRSETVRRGQKPANTCVAGKKQGDLPMTTINDIWTAYDDAESRWTGCDWPTHFGCLDLNLDGISSRQAHHNAGHWAEISAGNVAYDDITSTVK
jgi:hypothetical protein